MPSLRNPVGPLPSSIYWRRRVVVLVVLAGVLALIGWLAFGGGGSGKKPVSGKGPGPAQSITPGPSGSGSGGSSDGSPPGSPSGSPSKGSGSGGSSGGSGSGTGAGAGSTSYPGSGPVSVSSGSGTGTGGSTAAAGTGGAGGVPAGAAATMALPVCEPDNLQFSLTSTQTTYGATQWPVFQYQISNNGGPACRINLGADAAVVQVSATGNGHVWSSADCPVTGAARWYPLGGTDGTLTANFQWGRTTSAPGCTPGAGGAAAAPGSYVVQVSVKGASSPTSAFTLAPFGS